MSVQEYIDSYKKDLQDQTAVYNQAAVNIERLRGAITALQLVLKDQSDEAAK